MCKYEEGVFEEIRPKNERWHQKKLYSRLSHLFLKEEYYKYVIDSILQL